MLIKIRIVVSIVVLLISAQPLYAQVYTDPTNGNVGIGSGTFTPRGKFDVFAIGDIYLNSNTINGAGQSLYLPGHILIAPHSSSGDISFLQARRSDNSGSTQLRIRTTNAGSLVDAIHIASNGNTGIGNLNPQSKLEISGSIAVPDESQVKLRGGLNNETGMLFTNNASTDPNYGGELRISHTQDGYNRYIILGGYNVGATSWTPQFQLNQWKNMDD